MKREYLNELIGLLYPDGIKCIVCGKEIPKNRYSLCNNCKLELNRNFCLRCGRHKVGVGDYCGSCADTVMYFDEARSAVNYTDNAKILVHRLKYGDAKYLASPMSEFLLDVLLDADWTFDCFTFVPSDKKRYKKRGYNQAKLLAMELASRTTTPCYNLLQKLKPTPNQARLNREERIVNIKGAFSVTDIGVPERIVLVDDVMTTGATASECAKTLKDNGAKTVFLLTFASVPDRPLTDSQSQNIHNFRSE